MARGVYAGQTTHFLQRSREPINSYVSIETTERYLGCKQRIRSAVNDLIGIEPDA